ncbi:hypothetical protein AB0F91_09340 [Amycolatopsis sp. NPDC023774]|uniref:hypothetical protein n=1 Tax=Amycolatopsis sp. NPDC023774 TaxID=3155015 RepID=UPI0033EF6268
MTAEFITGYGRPLGCCAGHPATALVAAAEHVSREFGAVGVRLETGVRQHEARRRYQREGDRRIPAPRRTRTTRRVCYAEDQVAHSNGRSNVS